MLTQRSRIFAIMLAFIFGFASIGAEVIPEGIMPKRAVVGTGVSTSSNKATTSNSPTTKSNTPTSSNSPTTNKNDPSTSQQQTTQSQQPSTSSPTTVAVTTTNKDGSTVTSHISTETAVAASSKTSAVETESGKKNSVVKVGSKTIDPATLSHKTTVTHALVTKHTQRSTFTSLYTSDGHVYKSVITDANVVASTTGFATATIAPSLADGGGNGSNLSTNTKAIIGGVVGGIGGAILIGGLAFVAWRLWGKKRQQQQADDDGMFGAPYGGSSTGSVTQEKRNSGMTLGTEGTGSGTNGLERYQNPNGAVNTASNF